LFFGSGASDKTLNITTTGNVGIGSTAPAEKLDLNCALLLESISAPSPTTNKLYNNAGTLTWNGSAVGGSPAFSAITTGTNTTATMTLGTGGTLSYTGGGVVNASQFQGTSSVTGSAGSVVLSTAPTFTTSITDPVIYGGTAAGSTLTLAGTSNGSPSGAHIILNGTGQGNVGIGTSTTNAKLTVNGSVSIPITTKTGSYGASTSDYTILCNAASAMTITLPAISGTAGVTYVIKKIDSNTAYTVTVRGNSTEQFEGVASGTKVLSRQYASIVVQSDGTSWWILNDYYGNSTYSS
jgi:hypothetical protein